MPEPDSALCTGAERHPERQPRKAEHMHQLVGVPELRHIFYG